MKKGTQITWYMTGIGVIEKEDNKMALDQRAGDRKLLICLKDSSCLSVFKHYSCILCWITAKLRHVKSDTSELYSFFLILCWLMKQTKYFQLKVWNEIRNLRILLITYLCNILLKGHNYDLVWRVKGCSSIVYLI